MDCIESKELGALEYRRFEFASARLGQQQTLGIVRPKGNRRPQETVYYFHAGYLDDRMLLQLELLAQLDEATSELLVSRGVQFALPNFGLNFLLSSKEDAARPFHEYFFEEVMPRAEEGTDTTAATRFLSGASLGGHSVLVAFLRRPDLFKGVASTASALMNFDFHSDVEFERYARDGRLSSDTAATLKQIFLGCFASYDLYRQIDPVRLLAGLEPRALGEKRIMIDVGSADDFGFQPASSDFSNALSERMVPHRFDLVDGAKHDPAFLQSRFVPMLRHLLGVPAASE